MTDRPVVVVGQLARDVVLVVDELPPAGEAADVAARRETLGGKGANQAVAVAQLGAPVALVAVAGDDVIGDQLLAQAVVDGIDVSRVARRRETLSGLIVEALEENGQWRYLQHLPEPVLLTPHDVEGAADLLLGAGAVLVQLQQPRPAVETAIRLARDGGALVVLDGAADPDLLPAADVLRADEREARMLAGGDDVRTAARKVVSAGPGLVAFAVEGGNLFVWRDRRWGEGELFLPVDGAPAVDTTGAGDAFVAALAVALLRGEPAQDAARRAAAASGSSVRHPGGRPSLTSSE